MHGESPTPDFNYKLVCKAERLLLRNRRPCYPRTEVTASQVLVLALDPLETQSLWMSATMIGPEAQR